jgi:hypothetical protein
MLAVTLQLDGAQVLVAGENVNVSNDYQGFAEKTARDQVEMSVDVDPSNPLRLAAVSHSFKLYSAAIEDLDQFPIGVYRSSDGGRSWNGTAIGAGGVSDPFHPVLRRYDPSIAFDRDGVLYVAYVVERVGGSFLAFGQSSIVVARSNDGGATFGQFSIVEGTSTSFLDKVVLAAGKNPSNPSGPDAVYVTYLKAHGTPANSHIEVLVAGSNDGGIRFMEPVRVNDDFCDPALPESDCTTATDTRLFFADPVVGPQGELLIAWGDAGDGQLRIDRDLDGLFDAPIPGDFQSDGILATPSNMIFNNRIPAQATRGIAYGLQLDIDPRNGTAYAVWTDTTDIDHSDDNFGFVDTDVFVATSVDLGATWSVPRAVNDDSTSAFLPWLDVDPLTGAVNIAYYRSAQEDGGTIEQANLIVQTSMDGGQTFSALTRVSSVASDARTRTRRQRGAKTDYLEYIGIASHAGSAVAVWADNRDAPAQDFEMYAAPLTFIPQNANSRNVLHITGTDGPDDVLIAYHSANPDYMDVTVNGILEFRGRWASVGEINFVGHGGNDQLELDASINTATLPLITSSVPVTPLPRVVAGSDAGSDIVAGQDGNSINFLVFGAPGKYVRLFIADQFAAEHLLAESERYFEFSVPVCGRTIETDNAEGCTGWGGTVSTFPEVRVSYADGPDGIGETAKSGPLIVGDFDTNGMVDIDDVDLLSTVISMSPYDAARDLDRDSDTDLVDLELLVNLVLRTYLGDANLDGFFNSSDFVQVFQIGEYEDLFNRNSTWRRGDWNADADATSADLVIAFQDGGYRGG